MWPVTPVRPRIFVSYHHGNDQRYYSEFSLAFHDTYEAIQDNSVDRIIDSEDTGYVIRRIRENFITGTSCTVVLCGPETRWRKYVDWEIKATLDKQHGLIGIDLPNNPLDRNGLVHIPDRLQDNIYSGYALWIAWEDLGRGSEFLKACVLEARGRSAMLIQNSRPLRQRNG
ncbi:MAG TPA: TIR domain-containing protein [Thermoanaerobaculia bacterium]|nr:TIR domain-containing protein [Thermoanaerobaculia bacterium]